MKKWIPLAIVLVATAAGSFLIGRSTASSGPDLDRPDRDAAAEQELARLREENARLRRPLPAPVDAAEADAAAAEPETAPAPGMRPAYGPAPAGDTPVGPRPDLTGVTSVEEASARLMAFVAAQLDRGEAGYQALLETLTTIDRNEDLRRLFSDEAAAVPQLYPWIKFLVSRDVEITDMTEWVFRTMAEDPQRFAKIDNDPLEIFTEGMGMMLPGIVTDERLATIRGYAEKVLAAPEESQPKAIQRARRDLEQLVGRYWAEPIPLDRAVEMLKSGELALDSPQARSLLSRIPPEAFAELDLPSLLGPLAEQGRYEATMILQRVPKGTLNPEALDTSVLRGLDAGKVNAGFLMQYLRSTGRTGWTEARGLLERGFSGTKESQTACLQFLVYLPADARPEKQYVADLLARTTADENAKTWVKRAYGIE